MREGYYRVGYRSMPSRWRFGILSMFGVYNEHCYTQEEIQFRQQVLKARENTALDKSLLGNHQWFDSNPDNVFIDVNLGSWFFNPAFLPRKSLTLDDFHMTEIISPRFQWQSLNVLIRKTADYLLIRNQALSAEYLNQPMNFVLLDMVEILKRLALMDDPNYLAEQLNHLNNYLRAIEIHVSPTVGSDRLFLADCRSSLEATIENEMGDEIKNQLLKKQLAMLTYRLNTVAALRHTVLHFALAANAVNSHPYWEFFQTKMNQLDSQDEFPTLAAKACAEFATDTLNQFENHSDATLSSLELTPAILKKCAHFKFIDNVSEKAIEAYTKSLNDLQELVRFRGILNKLLQLFEQGGEVFALSQFRLQMTELLKTIEHFVQDSQHHLLEVLEANTQAYHQSVQERQDLSWWKKITSNKQFEITIFINNQDNLARFAATTTDIRAASRDFLRENHLIIQQLNEQSMQSRQVKLLSTTQELAQDLVDLMHSWTNHQHQQLGLPTSEKPQIEWNISTKQPLTFFPPAPALPDVGPNRAQENNAPNFHPAAIGFILMLPLCILLLIILYDAWFKSKKTTGDKHAFEKASTQVADRLIHLDREDQDEEVQYYFKQYANLQRLAVNNVYDEAAMQELLEDLKGELLPYAIKTHV